MSRKKDSSQVSKGLGRSDTVRLWKPSQTNVAEEHVDSHSAPKVEAQLGSHSPSPSNDTELTPAVKGDDDSDHPAEEMALLTLGYKKKDSDGRSVKKHKKRAEASKVNVEDTDDWEGYQQLLTWARDEVRAQVVSKEYLDNPENFKRLAAFLYKPIFTEKVLKHIAIQLAAELKDMLHHFKELSEKIEAEYPDQSRSLKKTQGVVPPVREGIWYLWNEKEKQVLKMDLSGDGAHEFRRALAVMSRDSQVLYQQVQELKSVYEELNAKQKGKGKERA